MGQTVPVGQSCCAGSTCVVSSPYYSQCQATVQVCTNPTGFPVLSSSPSASPTAKSTTSTPSVLSSKSPTAKPSTLAPTAKPSSSTPTAKSTSSPPTAQLSIHPSNQVVFPL
mmetsp:Transcript_32375/g.44357  ORF Transcript_32375/g.44357 Transcript_32375/m.44357 type:complete len:112 (-) Transcript_32375:712-1047(-)